MQKKCQKLKMKKQKEDEEIKKPRNMICSVQVDIKERKKKKK
jgi:hypothetical protein